MIENKTVHAFIQVSLTSTRLPGKALINIHGIPAIERVIQKLKKSKFIDKVIMTFTDGQIDDPLEKYANNSNHLYYRGDFHNVIKRYYHALGLFPCDIIVRATGDCLCVSYELADLLIDSHFKSKAEFSIIHTNFVPIGVDCDVFNSESLIKLYNFNLNQNLSEYMTYYFINNPDYFIINIFDPPLLYNQPSFRLVLDYPEDLKMFNELFEGLEKDNLEPNLLNIIKLLEKHPEIPEINKSLSLKYITDKDLIEKINKATKINY